MKEKQLKFFNVDTKEEEEVIKTRHIVKIPLDTLILVVIINILSLIVAFSLGINTGKKQLISQRRYTSPASDVVIARLNYKRKDRKETIISGKRKVSSTHEAKETAAIKNKEENLPSGKRLMEGYIIQVASYLKETAARKETEHLKKSGFSAFLTKKGKYLVIYVGSFPTKKEAEKTKLILKKRFSDCFIKKI